MKHSEYDTFVMKEVMPLVLAFNAEPIAPGEPTVVAAAYDYQGKATVAWEGEGATTPRPLARTRAEATPHPLARTRAEAPEAPRTLSHAGRSAPAGGGG